ncbi:hypothetical protein BY996DRAFT_4584485 [Phakopsora pachyrhizi]|uniref:Maintenance of mitochondrial morphology protein 1 n=1 Tax=Phakopsora pachyrhizi TaxID=170000 RepID=A0AAV0ARD1_PHAPC|nr:hypothetical protein BY996DRAFT_4584485 [Phakopsora pachyrhizi]CAH7671117.1 hypothetical protein PPACK8108_LOCUS5879 [Phakopsora pachyrhizi]
MSSPQPNDQYIKLTFTQGFIVGQISLLVVVVMLVKYVMFEDSQTARRTDDQRKNNRSRRRKKSSWRPRSNSDSKPRGGTAEEPEILSKLAYDLSTHPPESSDWLNVLIAQAIIAYRSLVLGTEENSEQSKGEKARRMVEDAMNYARGESPGLISIDYITVTEVDFGEEYPICTNARVRPADETGRMRVEIDVDYSDRVTLAIETKVAINFPTTRFAVLPISLGLTLNQLSATVMAEIPPVAIPLPVDHDPTSPSPAILLSLDPDFTLSMITTSLLGSRAKLQDLPKIEQLILSRLRGWMVDNVVWPKVRVLRLPGLGRKGSIEDAADGEGEYVFVENERAKTLNSTKETPHEADDDEELLSVNSAGLQRHFPPEPVKTNRNLYPSSTVPISGIPLQSINHRRSLSGSSRPSLSMLAVRTAQASIPPARTRNPTKIDNRRTSVEADVERLTISPPGALPSSEISMVATLRRPSTNQNSLYQILEAEQHQQQQHNNGDGDEIADQKKRVGLSSEEQVRWARAGGMTGVSMGLGTQLANGTSYGIRERIRETERFKRKS